MLEHYYKDKLVKKLSKIKKIKSKEFENIKKKILEIISFSSLEELNHYKNLKNPLNKFKRVHINSSFVLIFKIDKNKNLIVFEDYEHHDKIYKKC